MSEQKIVQLMPECYFKVDSIVNTKNKTLVNKWFNELQAGERITYIYMDNDIYAGEVSLVFVHDDPICVIPGVRGYMQRLLVHPDYRGRGIAKALVDHLCCEAKGLGLSEISVSVDMENEVALHIYRTKGFNSVLFEGTDQYGACYKLMKILVE